MPKIDNTCIYEVLVNEKQSSAADIHITGAKAASLTGQRKVSNMSEEETTSSNIFYYNLAWRAVITLSAVCLALFLLIVILVLVLRWYVRRRTKNVFPHLKSTVGKNTSFKPVVVGFFHPYCNAGGGGERVLWTGIRALQKRYDFVKCVVYTGDSGVRSSDILSRAKERFNISLPQPVEFVFLNNRQWVEASSFPYFTLLGQSLGSLWLGWEALTRYVPDIFLDTMGYAFTLPLFKYIGGCHVGCYVHYPTISTDMLARVGDHTATYNNAAFISSSRLLSGGKLLYYHLFAMLYGLAGRCSDVIMVNSTWTYGHVVSIWGQKDLTTIVYPPCDTKSFLEIPIKDESSKPDVETIVSVGQFRPEKDHPLQLKSFFEFLSHRPASEKCRFKLILVGSVRNEEDNNRVKSLKQYAAELGIKRHVVFALNVSFSDLKAYLAQATIGLHTMWNEHFGIGVVECQAAGCIALAHDSGGPKMDIVIDWDDKPTGFLADDAKSYARAMETIFSLQPLERRAICENARKNVARFSEAKFESGFLQCTEQLFIKT